MPIEKLKSFLEENDIDYRTLPHDEALTAQEAAAAAHIKAKAVARTVMVKLDGAMAMAMVPATYHVDLEAFEALTGSGSVELAGERLVEPVVGEFAAR